jgi:hypothetical protein
VAKVYKTTIIPATPEHEFTSWVVSPWRTVNNSNRKASAETQP